MKPETFAQLLTIQKGRQAAKSGKVLAASAQTEEERAAARAFKRVQTGTVVLTLLLVISLMILVPLCLIPLEEGNTRYGTVQEDGQVRYTQDVHRFLSQEQLGLLDCGLQPGDRVVIFFDSVTDEITAAYPADDYEQYTNAKLGLLVGYMVFMVVILLLYAVVVCRFTPFGSDWYLYCKKQQSQEAEDIPLRAKIVIYAVSLVIALAVCWPQIQNLMGDIQQMQRVGVMREMIQSAQEAAEHASEMVEALETVGQSVEIDDALADAGSAAENIREILDSMNGD